MTTMPRHLPTLAALALTAAACTSPPEPVEILMTNGQGEIAGEATDTTIILQTRLTAKSGWVDGDLPGMEGVVRFEFATNPEFAAPRATPWLEATAENDYIVKVQIEGLTPGTEYLYRVLYGPDPDNSESGPTRSFATHPGPDAEARTSFTVVTGMNYYQFYDNPDRMYTGPDKELGFPGLTSMLALEPDFFIATGDNVYYDAPYDGRATTAPTMRKKWHEQLGRQRFIDFFADTPTYWEKDDHDYRYNDCDNTTDAAPLPELGRRIFLEQVPVADPNDPDP